MERWEPQKVEKENRYTGQVKRQAGVETGVKLRNRGMGRGWGSGEQTRKSEVALVAQEGLCPRVFAGRRELRYAALAVVGVARPYLEFCSSIKLVPFYVP